MRQIGGRLVAWGGWTAALPWRSDQLRSARVQFPRTRAGLHGATADEQRSVANRPRGRTRLQSIPEASDVTEADRIRCRALIEAAGFHAVDYEEDGAAWERMFREGDCLVLAVRESTLFGKPERKEWTLTRFLKDGTRGGSAGPVTLGEALDVARTLSGLPRFAWGLL